MSFNIAGLLNPTTPPVHIDGLPVSRHLPSSPPTLQDAPSIARLDSSDSDKVEHLATAGNDIDDAGGALTALARPTFSARPPLHPPFQRPDSQPRSRNNSSPIATHDAFRSPYAPRFAETNGSPPGAISPVATPLEPNPALDNLPLQRSPTLEHYHHGSRSPEEHNRRVSAVSISHSPKLAPIQNLSDALNSQLHRDAAQNRPEPPTNSAGPSGSAIPGNTNRSAQEELPTRPPEVEGVTKMADTTDNRDGSVEPGIPSMEVGQPSASESNAMQLATDHAHLSVATPKIKSEPSVTPRETSPHPTTEVPPKAGASIPQADGGMDNMDEETYKAIQEIKNSELGLRRTASHPASAQTPPKEASEPAPKKRPAPSSKNIAATKKGIAKKPPPKKRRLSFDGEDDETARRSSGPKVPKTNHNPGSKAKPAAKSKNDTGSDAEDDGQVYCICRRGDDHSFMLACDNCDEWFHAQCVRLTKSDCDQIDAYICPNCEKEHGLKSTWKPICRNPKCHRVARVGEEYQGRESKYCSDECALEFFRDKAADKASQTAAKRRKANRADHDGNEPARDASAERRRGEALRLQDLRSIVDHVGSDVEKFRELGHGDLAMLTPPESGGSHGGPLLDDAALQELLLPEERARLASIEAAKAEMREQRAYLDDRNDFIQMAKENAGRYAEREGIKAKDVCGFDRRLTWDESRLRRWWKHGGRPGLPGDGAVGNADADAAEQDGEGADTKMADADAGAASDDDDNAAHFCTKKRCARHQQWQKLQVQDVRLELSGTADRMRELEADEREVRERAVLRARSRGVLKVGEKRKAVEVGQ